MNYMFVKLDDFLQQYLLVYYSRKLKQKQGIKEAAPKRSQWGGEDSRCASAFTRSEDEVSNPVSKGTFYLSR